MYRKLNLILHRRTLATTPYLVRHLPNPSKAQSSPMTEPISSLAESLPPSPLHTACTHHFLHPLSWMRPALEQGFLDGRLECPNAKCHAQIGRYAWQGMKCSCGIWVCPAFSLQKGRVDEIVKRGEDQQGQGEEQVNVAEAGIKSGRAGIRLPPGMRDKGNL